MVAPVEEDARGILAPDVGLARFRLDRHAPSPAVARFVDRYWVVTWNLTGQPPHTQRVFAHPVVNVVLAGVDATVTEATVTGVPTAVAARVLEGAGWALGMMFRPAGFCPFLGRSLSTITDRVVPLAEVFGDTAAARLVDAMGRVTATPERVRLVDRFLAALVPVQRQASESTSELVEQIAADRTLVRVETLATLSGSSVRQLQRRFASHVGVSPKAVIRRYRLFEAAERARRGPVNWAALAVELGYSDQSHLIRDFTAAVGVSPDRYARACAAS